MSDPISAVSASSKGGMSRADEIVRFTASERRMHWAVAVPFMACWASALVLVLVYNPDPTRPFRPWFAWTHRVAGLSMLVLPLLTILVHWYDLGLHLRNIRAAWRWTVDDFVWIFLKGPSIVVGRITLPEQGKFNAGEKINFMVLTATWPIYVTTGVLIWSHQFAFAAWTIHLSLAALATPLLLGHIYLATVNPDTRVGLSGMVSGFVNREWAAHHYTGWYREHFGHHHGVASVAAQAAAPPALVDPAHESLVAVGLSTSQPAGAPAVAVMKSTPGADTTTIEPSWPPDAILWAVSLEAAQDAPGEEQEEEPQSLPQVSVAADDGGAGAAAAA